ncbi:response regulator transcription factor [Anaerocolumna sp. MB42-C2]|uniref:response regulator transcription factor n=1 Tax=Anaerocolumna sp. MB42-C2 TaxID=3070997 RepID=UPI0027DFD5AB|nr:response regulator [Anaerocolumna sp. MB42-C2]WMJ87154.1 response regulator [Anaerocolumna sp. MB42-C2]
MMDRTYKILIADDEENERNVIRFLSDKYQFPLDILEAANGKEVLSLLETYTPQILFTDIKMPFFNGIEVASEIRKRYPHMQIIFFSGYDDFEYVKEALSLKAVNYILKPVNPDEFKKTLSSVIDVIKEEEMVSARLKVQAGYLKNHILYQLINRTSIELLSKQYPSMDLAFTDSFHRLFLIQFEEDFFGSVTFNNSQCVFMERLTNQVSADYWFINLNPSQSLILFTNQETLHWYYETAGIINRIFFELFHKNSYISISNFFNGADSIAYAYQEVESQLEKRFYSNGIYIFGDENSDITKNEILYQDDQLLKNIEKDISLNDIFSLRQNTQILLQKYENQISLSHIYVRFILTNLLSILLLNTSDYKEAIIQEAADQIYSFQHFSEIKDYILKTLENLIKELENKSNLPRNAIHMVEQYINKHYGDELSLNILANRVFLTPSYLSNIFIQETGCGINKYIKSIRMEKAKELLLTTNMKITEICQKVGYSNVSYFCKSFQEEFGKTPDKYRHSNN